jgi:hypothetical protein
MPYPGLLATTEIKILYMYDERKSCFGSGLPHPEETEIVDVYVSNHDDGA